MTKVIDLLELYRVLNDSDDPELLLKDMMEEASLDTRIDRDILADTLVAECGSMYPRWNTTTVFKRFGINFFRRASREIRRDLDALELEYSPLMEYEESRSEVVGEEITDDTTRTDNLQRQRTDNLTSTRTDDLTNTRTDNLQSQRTDNLTSTRTDDLTNTRTDNLQSQRTDNLQSERTDNLTSERTDNLEELRTPNLTDTTTPGAGSQIDRLVSADNETDLVIRSRDVATIAGESVSHTGTEQTDHTGTQTTENTGTQTTENTGTQTTADTGTQTTESTGTQTTANNGTQTTVDTGTQTSKETGTQSTKDTGTQTTADTGTQRHERDYGRDLTREHEISGRKRTGAELIREEIAANHFNIYDIIVRKFADQMLLGVY